MKRAVVGVAMILAAVQVRADNWSDRVSATLEGVNEVPAVSTPARGRFVATIHDESVEYELSFRNLQAAITQSHIHFAQPNVNGGIMVWLCGTATNPGPAGTQECPASGTISGVITAEHVIAVTPQGIAPGEFGEFVRALRKGLAYANIHTAQSPGGEIRGQVKPFGFTGKGGHDEGHGSH